MKRRLKYHVIFIVWIYHSGHIVTVCDIIQFTLHKSVIIRKWLNKYMKIREEFPMIEGYSSIVYTKLVRSGSSKYTMKGGLLLEQSVISRKYIKFILQFILAVCIQCVITFFWHQERTFLFYTLSLYVSVSLSDDLSRLICRNEKWCRYSNLAQVMWQIRGFSYSRFRKNS